MTPTSTNTPTVTPTSTNTPTGTPTVISTETPTETPTTVATNTPTETPTVTPTDTPTATPTNTPAVIATNTPTPTPSACPDLDQDHDGILDSDEGTGDADGDGIPNFLDLDSDGDGVFDIVEAGGASADTNNDGVADNLTDANCNGILDIFETSQGGTPLTPQVDSDNDGIPNFLDAIDNNFPGCIATENLPAQKAIDRQAKSLSRITSEMIKVVQRYHCRVFTKSAIKKLTAKATTTYNSVKNTIFTGIPARFYTCSSSPIAGCSSSDLTASLTAINSDSTTLRRNVTSSYSRCSKNLYSIKRVDRKAVKVLSKIKKLVAAVPNPELLCLPN
jgi:hypothetical protein